MLTYSRDQSSWQPIYCVYSFNMTTLVHGASFNFVNPRRGWGGERSQGISLYCSRPQEAPTPITLQDTLCTCSTTESHTTLAHHTTEWNMSYGHCFVGMGTHHGLCTSLYRSPAGFPSASGVLLLLGTMPALATVCSY